MRRFRCAIAVAIGLLPAWLEAPGTAQPEAPPLLPPPPALATPLPPEPSAEEIGRCVPSYGNTGCAARLYARLLCGVVGQVPMPEGLQQQLDGQYERAAINFQGITVEQVESAAVRYYVPMLCPNKSRQIQELFAPMEATVR